LNHTNPAAPSTPTRAAVTGARYALPLYSGGSIWVLKHDLAAGDVFTERVGWHPNGNPRWESSRIMSIDKVQGTMQITFGANETKTLRQRDLVVTQGPKIGAAKANPDLVAVRAGRSVWVGGEAVQA
jgi:hypothetical protein